MRIVSNVRSILLALVVLAMSATSNAQVGIAITIGPPALPVYEQPLCPSDGYIWAPGYWAYDYDESDYYWVPGTWVLAPQVGFLWTPGYWGWGGDRFVFNEGYWGPNVGFYGGINYGFGYFGDGYQGGRWDRGQFFYNRSVNNVNVTIIHNVYNTTVINNTTVNRVSYNGGKGGINARPRPEQEAAAHERHIPPVAAQTEHAKMARTDPGQRASLNHGRPAIAASPKPGVFKAGAVPAKEAGAPYTPPGNRNQAEIRGNGAAQPENHNQRPVNAVHPNELPTTERPAPPNTGNDRLDRKYQQQQQKLYANQDKDRQKLQRQQEKDHQQVARQNTDDARKQQVEQHHQQQTQQLEQRHVQQQQQLQQKQQPPHRDESRPSR